jgi:putative hydrolase of the HAD superfamily
MIRNIVFDFGQVLCRFDPPSMTAPYVENDEDRDLVSSVVFDRLYWDRLDAGTISDEEVVTASKARLPARLHDAAERAYYGWLDNLPPIKGMWELVERLYREKDVKIFVLSNISRHFAANASRFPVFRYAEDLIFSAECGHTKPHADMFEYLCERCHIKPSETLFIDDSPKNIEGAAAFGINGYLFDGDAERLWQTLSSLPEKGAKNA